MEAVPTAIDLFRFAIETLGRIQLAREFEKDFDIHQLKLDIVQLRLSRWGEIISINTLDETYKNDKEHAGLLAEVRHILDEIQDLLCGARKQAVKVQDILDPSGAQVLDPEACMPLHMKKVRVRFGAFLRKRKGQTTKTIESVKWVFYKKEQFEKFVANISEMIDHLEKLIQDDERKRLRQLSSDECKGISKASLEELKEIIGNCDPWLECSVEEILTASGSGTMITQSYNTGSTVGVHNGDNKGNSYGASSTQTNTFH